MLFRENYQASQTSFGFCFVLKSCTINNLSNCSFLSEQHVGPNIDMKITSFLNIQEVLTRGVNLHNVHNIKVGDIIKMSKIFHFKGFSWFSFF